MMPSHVIDNEIIIRILTQFLQLKPGFRNHIRQLRLQGMRDPDQIEKRDVPLSTLNFSHMRSVDLGFISQGFLRKSDRFSL